MKILKNPHLSSLSDWFPWQQKKIDWGDLDKKKFTRVLRPEYIDCQEIKTIGSILWPVHRSNTEIQTDRQTNRGDQHTLRKISRFSQSNERALLECILCKIGLTD